MLFLNLRAFIQSVKIDFATRRSGHEPVFMSFTCKQVKLPKRENSDRKRNEDHSIKKRIKNMTRILVISDTQELLEMFCLLLERENYEVVLSGMPILKVGEVEQIQPDLIILDIIFGHEESGWQVLQMLKMQRSTASIPVIISTAALHEVQQQEGHLISQGVRVICKPFDIDHFLTLVHQALKPDGKPLLERADGYQADHF